MDNTRTKHEMLLLPRVALLLGGQKQPPCDVFASRYLDAVFRVLMTVRGSVTVTNETTLVLWSLYTASGLNCFKLSVGRYLHLTVVALPVQEDIPRFWITDQCSPFDKNTGTRGSDTITHKLHVSVAAAQSHTPALPEKITINTQCRCPLSTTQAQAIRIFGPQCSNHLANFTPCPLSVLKNLHSER